MAARAPARTGYGRRGYSRLARGLLLASSLGLVMLSGFLFGRFVIGEGYLRQTVAPAAVASQPLPAAPVPQSPPAPVFIPPLEEERPSPPTPGVERLPQGATEEAAPGAEQSPQPPAEESPGGDSGGAAAGERSPKEFTVQVGTFLRRESAEALAEQLRQSGKPARVVESAGGRERMSFFRVVSGSYQTEAAARDAADGLKDQGYEAFIIRAP